MATEARARPAGGLPCLGVRRGCPGRPSAAALLLVALAWGAPASAFWATGGMEEEVAQPDAREAQGGRARADGAESAAALFLPDGASANGGVLATAQQGDDGQGWHGGGTWFQDNAGAGAPVREDPAKLRARAGWVGDEFAITGSGGWYSGMYNGGFTGDFVMAREKYRKLARNAPVRVAKYKIQCLDPNPPRGCDLSAASGAKPRGRGWDRVGLVVPRFINALPETDFIKSFPQFETCAVVGNGGSLLAHELGTEIDGHDAIFRFNGGPVRGFERHVGARTTIRLANTQHMGFREFDDEVVLQHVTTEQSMAAVVILKKKNPSLRLFVTDGDFHQYVLDTMGDGAASNGFYGLILADERCAKVTVYGFGRSWDKMGLGSAGGHALYHYYDDVEPNTSQKGRDDRETPKLLQFIARRADKFRFGADWTGMSIEEVRETLAREEAARDAAAGAAASSHGGDGGIGASGPVDEGPGPVDAGPASDLGLYDR